MGEKRLVTKNRFGKWEVRAPSVVHPDSTHETREEAERAAVEFVERAGGGYVDIIL